MGKSVASVLFLSFCALAAPVRAQYSIDWHSIDGGGGTSTGGAYAISGSIGQADADLVPACSADGGVDCVGALYQIEGGFWAGLAPGSCTGALNCIFRDGFELLAPG